MKIGFLYNHDATHQVPHTISIASALAARGIDVTILTSSEAQREIAAALLRPDVGCRFVSLQVGLIARTLDRALHSVAPFRRLAILRENRGIFAGFDALVVPETTTAFLKTRYGMRTPKLIYQPHGAGDGEAGFQPITAAFDLVLLSGPKLQQRMLELELIRPCGFEVVGYPKFDVAGLTRPPKLFANDRPTVLYNPHFNPYLSSWYTIGRDILRWFAGQDRFNLIFAPHVMLFKRRVHTSLIHGRMQIRPSIPRMALAGSSVHVDTGSRRSIDMSYVEMADIYLGDVSSQIYEWIRRPRPAIFLNSPKRVWRDVPAYRHWRLGEIVEDMAALPGALTRAASGEDGFRAAQAQALSQTFSVTDQPAGERAADAIINFLTNAAE
jgi:hypothetical protein